MKQFALKNSLPYGRLLLWGRGERSIPINQAHEWCGKYGLVLEDYEYQEINLHQTMKNASLKGIAVLKKKFGEDWSGKLASKSMKLLHDRIRKDGSLRKKWNAARHAGLVKRFGDHPYEQMGMLGGRNAIKKLGKEALQERLESIFRKSFKKKITFEGMHLRSLLELEVAKILSGKKIPFCYEKKICGFYPDFFISSTNTIIEAFGFEWKPHIERTRKKIELFSEKGYNVIVYTYPNLLKYFDGLNAHIVTERKLLEELL